MQNQTAIGATCKDHLWCTRCPMLLPLLPLRMLLLHRRKKQRRCSCGVKMTKDDAITDGHWGCCSCRCRCCGCTVAKRKQKQTMCSCGIDTHAQRRCKDKRALGPLVFDTAASLAVANVATAQWQRGYKTPTICYCGENAHEQRRCKNRTGDMLLWRKDT